MPRLNGKPKRRLNVVAVCLNLYVPWIVFCLVLCMLTFFMHWKAPSACYAIVAVLYVVFGGGAAAMLVDLVRRWYFQHDSFGRSSWLLFFFFTNLAATIVGQALGNYIYFNYSETHFD